MDICGEVSQFCLRVITCFSMSICVFKFLLVNCCHVPRHTFATVYQLELKLILDEKTVDHLSFKFKITRSDTNR